MQYLNKSDETWRASAPYSDIYIYFIFNEIRFRDYLVKANYMDYRSI